VLLTRRRLCSEEVTRGLAQSTTGLIHLRAWRSGMLRSYFVLGRSHVYSCA